MQVWAQDEARLGLIPIVRRVWAPRGKRVWAPGHRRYQWLYLFGFVHPATGASFFLLLPTVNTMLMSMALQLFATQVGAGPQRHVVLVLDGAGWHVSSELQLPIGIHLVQQPAYSPELQPSERLWPLVREAIANKCYTDLDALELDVANRCNQLGEQSQLVRAHTLLPWWPDDVGKPNAQP